MSVSLLTQPASIALPSPLIRCGFIYGFSLLFHHNNPVSFSSDNGVVATLENCFYGGNCIAVTDVGQHQMWAAQRCHLTVPRCFLTSGGLGTMGFGLGAAIGAYIATGRRPVLFTGDGCFRMNLTELATAVAEKVPVVIVIFNNGVLGMVRQWQTLFFDGHHSATTLPRTADFVKIAEGFGAGAMRAHTPEELKTAAETAFAQEMPFVIDCIMDPDETVLPMLPPGGSFADLITEI